MKDSLLSGLRALDLTDAKGFVCGQFMASLGVDVIKIEKPGGDSARDIPPFYHDQSDRRHSLYWNAFNTGKRGITLNLEAKMGQDLFRVLVKNADFVLESFSPGYMDNLGIGYEALRLLNQRVIVASITHFGQKGPYKHYRGSELIDSAMSGILGDTGHPDRPPVKEALDSLYFHAGAAAALGAMMAHYSRRLNGEGQQIDISIQETAVSRAGASFLPWQWDKRLVTRAGVMSQFGALPTRKVWRCKDGYVFWMLAGGPLGAPANRAISEWMAEDKIDHPLSHMTNWEELDMATIEQQTLDNFQEAVSRFFLKHTKQEITEEGLKRGINSAVVNNVSDVLEEEQFSARDFWVGFDHPELDIKVKYPRHFLLSNETETYIRCQAPDIGQDNDQIYVKELGLSAVEIAELKEAHVI
ncbi:CaiB/BaiF CoA transferase family protein [Thermodesulfobacteriota bacterium]